jgi:ubiquinone/menaquinone biosynthesis C-methylase UbiE/DNA-binding transcriptional ArsR family regulator
MVNAAPARRPPILDRLASLADATRSRLLLLLDGHELTVSELCAIAQLPQSTVSRHLKALSDSGWVAARTEGTSHLYTMSREGAGGNGHAPAQQVWALVRDQVKSTAAANQDQHRLRAALADRRTRSQEFFASSAGKWDRLRDELFGDRFYLAALGGLAGADWVLGDLGCGTGQMSAAIAPFVAQVVAIDESAAMLQAARARLRGFDNVELRRGALEALPIDDGHLDAATMTLVLHHVPEPGRALAEVARVLKPGGRLLVVDMLPHDRESYRPQMGHIWLGFPEEHVHRLLSETGFVDTRIVPLVPDARAKGPALFVASANTRASRVQGSGFRVQGSRFRSARERGAVS